MKYTELSLPRPESNLACDEALLDGCEQGGCEPVLRVWESARPFVVLGYANHVEREVSLEACAAQDIPVLRRCTGGGSVLQGPGCLNYSLVLPIEEGGPVGTITGTNRWIMERHGKMLSALLGREVSMEGDTDLALDGRKFSGNAQRRRRRFVLFHGTFLLGLDLELIQTVLPAPSKQPAYRRGRSHLDFVRNVPVSAAKLKQELQTVWQAHEPLLELPMAAIEQLVQQKYSRSEWNLRR